MATQMTYWHRISRLEGTNVAVRTMHSDIADKLENVSESVLR
jgi:hypothetical protein